MNNKSWFSREVELFFQSRWSIPTALLAVCSCTSMLAPLQSRADAPTWLRVLTGAAVPEHDEKTDAVLLLSEDILTVQPNGKIKRLTRRAYKILRLKGKEYGVARAYVDAETKVQNMKGWCIPTQGKDYEVKEKDSIETSLTGIANAELVSDLRVKLLPIPAAEPGNIVGYEIEQEERPLVFQEVWRIQDEIPVKEARLTLQLPPGWEYKATWMNSGEVKPTAAGNNQWQWVVNDIKAIRSEDDMPPWRGIASQLLISILPSGGAEKKAFESWSDMGMWETNLAQGRRDPSAEIKQKVVELTAGKTSTLGKMQALAEYVQRDIRYVAIELGIGGWQPHAASDIYTHHYGDCKDKATLLSAMLREIGADSYYLSVIVTRGAVTQGTPPQMYLFNHEILGIRLPDDLTDASLLAVYKHPTLGRILAFDPTDELTPLGQLRGALQANYGLLVTPEGGDLIQLPMQALSTNGIRREAKLVLSSTGTLSGDVIDVRIGDYASMQRSTHKEIARKEDQIKPIETLLAHSLGTYQIIKASIGNLDKRDQPFQYQYSFVIPSYAKTAGELLLVRPRVLGEKSSDILEKKEPRKYPVEFEGPRRDNDRMEITLPEGYQVDELPSPTDVDYSFGSYHSKTELKGNTLVYTRTFEIKEVSVPLEKMEDLKKFYRIIGSDERGTAVLKPIGH